MARRAGPKRQSSGGSRSARSRSTTSSARSRQQGGRQQVGELNKTQLVERLGRHLNKLKRDDLVSLVERVESKTLDLSTLTLSGDGGFGFQEGAPEAGSGEGGSESSGSGSSGDGGDSGDGEGLLERGADEGRSLLDKAKSAITG